MLDRLPTRRVAIGAVAILAFAALPLQSSAAAGPRDVFALDGAAYFGSGHAAQPIVGMAGTPSGRGYWLVASDGGVFSFGDARFHGSTGGRALNRPIVGMAATRSGRGYWLVASDGGVFCFGDARFHGSTGGRVLNRPIVGMAATPSGHGYWLVASDGGVFSFGDARFHGSAGKTGTSIVGLAPTPSGRGYWLAASNGQVFARGDASRPQPLRAGVLSGQPIVAVAASRRHHGYWLAGSGDGTDGRQAEAAISWFQQRTGSSAYEEKCETAVENAYGVSGVYPTARANWQARPDKHADWQDAPRGALVFYDTSADGHVAISLGNGDVVSTSVDHHIGVAPIGFFQNPLGWAAPPW